MKTTIFILQFIIIFSFSQAQKLAEGIVYEDSNANGKKERKESGIAGVAVSNGTHVVLTDAEGHYEIPIDQDDIIFVIKPSSHEIPLNALHLPQYYYVHKPQGSPQTDFPGVAPTGKLPSSIDFALLPAKDNENFTALIFGDPQPYTQEEVAFFDKDVVEEVVGIEGVPFGLSLGDLVGDDLDLFHPYNEAISRIGIPWWNVYGNHDMNYDAPADTLADETFEATYGPANYAFNYGKVHFIVLDDVMYPDPRDGKGYWGGFREDMFVFMENDLKQVPKDHLVVIAFHIPLFDASDDNDTFKDEDRARFFALLEEYPNTLSLSAHTHLQRHDFFTKDDGWKRETPHHHYNVGTTSGDWYSGKLNEKGVPFSTMRDGTPKGYAFISFEGNQYSIDYKVVGEDENYRMRIFTPRVVPHEGRTSAGIYVNFFQGSEKASLRYRVDRGNWKDMSYIIDLDPSYLGLLHEWDYTEELMAGRRPSNAVPSHHLWRAAIPTNLPVGKHTLEVEATDMFGRKFTDSTTYKIENPPQKEQVKESEEE